MPDPKNSSPQNSSSEKKKFELTMEHRLLLSFGLMILVLIGSSYFKPPQPVPPKQADAPKKADAAAAVQPTGQPPVAPPDAKSKAPASAGAIVGAKDDTFTVETDLDKVRFTSTGAVVESWLLKKYKDGKGGLVDLVNPLASPKGLPAPFTLLFKDQKPAAELAHQLYVGKPSADGLGIDFEYSEGGVVSKKSFQFKKDSYLTDVSSEVSLNGARLSHLLAWRGGFGDFVVQKAYAAQSSTYYDTAKGKLVTQDYKAGKDGPQLSGGNYTFAGLQDAYFAAVFLPKGGTYTELQSFSDLVPTEKDGKSEEWYVGAAVGGAGLNQFTMFTGPKDIQLLRKIDPKLELMIDWGTWFGFLAKPLHSALAYVHDHWASNWGWAIVIVTVIINLLLLPLKFTSLQSSKKMQAMQPELQRLQKKYDGIGMKDPRKQEQQAEMMAIYKRHGFNPMSGCLPMVLQLPFFISFLTVLNVSIDLRLAPWLWVTDLSQPETIAIRMLPLIMTASQLLMQLMTPATSADPQQKMMMYMMPVMFLLFFYNSASGLVFYWLTSNVVGVAQQGIFNKISPPPKTDSYTVVVTKADGKK